MVFARLLWVGLICAVGALVVKLFPGFAFSLGMDLSGAWLLFGFGVFLILAGMAFATKSSPSPER